MKGPRFQRTSILSGAIAHPAIVWSCLFLLLFAMLLTGRRASAQNAALLQPENRPRIVLAISSANLLTVKGSTHPLVHLARDLGPVESTLEMGDLVLVLKRADAQQSALDQFNVEQYDPKSPNYHRWLSPQEFGNTFGANQDDIDTTVNWLESQGFTIQEVPASHMAIRFSGAAGQVERAFHTEIHNFDFQGEAHIANISDIQIPAALSPVVVGVKALHNFFAKPSYRKAGSFTLDGNGHWQRADGKSEASKFFPNLHMPEAKEKSSPYLSDQVAASPEVLNSSGAELLAPYDLATIYNYLPLWQVGTPIDGTGVTIAIAGTSNIVLNDIATFRTATGLPSMTPKVVFANSDPGLTGAREENTLDVEWSGAAAKGANITLVTSSAPTTSTDPLYLSESYAVNNKTAPILSVSYGSCELFMGQSGNREYANLWQQAYTEGIAVFVSSGDSGAPACDQSYVEGGVWNFAELGLSVNGFASTPWNVAVGGTDFSWSSASFGSLNTSNLSSATGYIPEIVWNDTFTNPLIVSLLNSANGTNYNAWGWVDRAGLADFSEAFTLEYAEPNGGGGGVSSCTGASSLTFKSNNPTEPIVACSGGYAKPSWQAGVTGISASDLRTIPDVSFFAAPGYLGASYLMYDSGDTSCAYSGSSETCFIGVGGTSVSTPLMAGIMAMIDQKMGTPQGNPNPVFYSLAGSQDYSKCNSNSITNSSACYFNDITVGNNSTPCYHANAWAIDCYYPGTSALGILETPADYNTGAMDYPATVGYDKATGLGSMNVANVVNAWTSPTALAVSTTSLPAGATLTSYSEQLSASGGTAPYTWSATGVPTGMSLSGSGVLSGSPTATGTSPIAVTVADSGSPQQTATANLNIAISLGLPIINSITPASIIAGSSDSTITVNGGNFASGTTVNWGSTALTTAYVSSTQLTAVAPASLLASPGTTSITVNNSSGVSSGTTFTIVPQPPVISSLSPASATAGGAAFTLTINGSNFVSGATAYLDTTALTTTYISSTQLTAAVPANLISAMGLAVVTVTSSGGSSAGSSFAINPAVPAISSLSPSAATVASAGFTLIVNGSSFVSGATVNWGSTALTTTYISGSQLTAVVPASLIAANGSFSITVNDSIGTSGTETFNVYAPPANASIALSNPTFTAKSLTLTAKLSASDPTGVTGYYLSESSTPPSIGTPGWVSVTSATSYSATVSISAAQTQNANKNIYAWFRNTVGGISSMATGTVSITGTTYNTSLIGVSINSCKQLQGSTCTASQVIGWCYVKSWNVGFNCAEGFYGDGNNGDVLLVQNSQGVLTYMDGFLTGAVNNQRIATYSDLASIFGISNSTLQSSSIDLNSCDDCYIVTQIPTITSISPASVTAASGAFTVTINGANFGTGTQDGSAIHTTPNVAAYWGSTKLTTTYVSATQATASVPANLLLTAGTANITVVSDGGTTGAAVFTVNAATTAPTISSLLPISTTAGEAAFTLTVNGANLTADAVVNWGATPLTTNFVSSSQLTAEVPANLIASSGVAGVSVSNAIGASPTSTFTIVGALTPIVNVTPSANSIPSTQPLPVTVAVTDGTGNPTPTGTITLSSGNYTSAAVALDNGSTTISIPAGALAVGPATLLAQYTPFFSGTTGYASASASAPVTVTGVMPTPTFLPVAGTYTSVQTVAILDANSAATLYYTTDGSSPTASSTPYTNPITVGSSETLNAIAIASGYSNSAVSSSAYTINLPPTITSLSPASATAGGAAFTLTINGTNFTSNSTAQWGGTALTTTYGSATQLTAAVPASLIATAGSASVTVTAAGATSSAATFTITAQPTPTITSLSPASATAGGAAFTLTINGTNFTSNSTAQWGSTSLTTTYGSATQLTAAVPASLIATAGSASVTVTTSGGTSAGIAFTINAVQATTPTITSLNPASATAGGAAFTLTINGTNFTSNSTAQWGSTSLTTTYGSATQLTAAVPASLIATAGSASVTVTTSGGTSAGIAFTINAVQATTPTITSLNPASATAGGAAFTLTINGTNFTSSSTAQWGTTSLTTTYGSATQLTAAVPASLIATAGSASVTVTTSAGTSPAATFTIQPGQTTSASFTLSNSGNITVNPGATTGNSATITVTPAGAFTGQINLTCTIATALSSPNDPPACTIGTGSVTIGGTTAGTATLSVQTTAATTSKNVLPLKEFFGGGSMVLAGLLLIGVPARRRKWLAITCIALLAVAFGVVGCGGGSGSSGTTSVTTNPGTTAGGYTVTVTGTDAATGKITSSTAVTLTVN